MPDRPNFLFIFPDQWRGDCLGVLDHPVIETPFLDELTSQGVTFTAAYAACPSCIAARACLATGQTPNTTGRIGYQDKVPWRYPVTMMTTLRDNGYQTMNVGKTHFYPQRAGLGFEINLSYETQQLGDEYENDYERWLKLQPGGTIVRDTAQQTGNNSWIAMPWSAPESLHPSTWNATAAIELLQHRDPQRPFFLQVGFHRPHPPLDPPMEFFQMFEGRELPPVPIGDWADDHDIPVQKTDASIGHLDDHLLTRARWAYYAQIKHLDYQIGRLIYFLRRKGWFDNTYIIFCADHGELLGDHHLFRKTLGYEGSAKLPFIVRAPKAVECPRDAMCDAPTTHMDIMPTVLEAAGIGIPGTVEGSSLLPWVRGEQPQWREFVHGEHSGFTTACQFVTDGKEKLHWETVSGTERFFNLTQDPQELHDLAGDGAYMDRVELWRRRLIDVLAERPEDGMSDGEKLIPGQRTPAVRPYLMEKKLDCDGVVRPRG